MTHVPALVVVAILLSAVGFQRAAAMGAGDLFTSSANVHRLFEVRPRRLHNGLTFSLSDSLALIRCVRLLLRHTAHVLEASIILLTVRPPHRSHHSGGKASQHGAAGRHPTPRAAP